MFEIIYDDSLREREVITVGSPVFLFLMIKDMEEKFEDQVWREGAGME